MGTSIALDITATSNVQPVTDVRNAIALTAEETKQFGKILAENNNNLDAATKKFVALKNAATGAGPAAATAGGGAGAGSAANSLATVPDIIDRTNKQVDAMNPRLRTAAAAMSRLAFESTNLGGSVQGAVRSAGMLSYSLAGLSDNAKIAGSAAGIGAIAIVIAAGIGLWEEYHAKLEKARELMDSLNAASVSLAAGLTGNQLGVKELQLADQFNKQKAEIEKNFKPGWLTRLLSGVQEATMSGHGAPDLSKPLIEAAGRNLVQADAAAAIEDARRKALANAGGFVAGASDPVTRYRAQRHLIEVEREQAIQKGELSEEAANARAHEQRRLLAKQGTDYERTLSDEAAAAVSATYDTVFQTRQKAADVAYKNEKIAVNELKVSEEDRDRILGLLLTKHVAITGEILRQKQLAAQAAHIQAGEGDLNPITRIKAEMAAIEARRVAAIKAGASEKDAAKIAENEKRALFTATLDAQVRSSDSLRRILTIASLTPIVNYLEGLAVQEAIKSIAHYADFDIVGGSLHASAAAAALAGARKVAQQGGLMSGSGGGGAGGASGGQFVPNAQQNGGNQTVIIQIGDVSNQALIQTVRYELDRSGLLNKPVVVPAGRPS